jgi:hypothetical protein
MISPDNFSYTDKANINQTDSQTNAKGSGSLYVFQLTPCVMLLGHILSSFLVRDKEVANTRRHKKRTVLKQKDMHKDLAATDYNGDIGVHIIYMNKKRTYSLVFRS